VAVRSARPALVAAVLVPVGTRGAAGISLVADVESAAARDDTAETSGPEPDVDGELVYMRVEARFPLESERAAFIRAVAVGRGGVMWR
jgi:hypothetical protein